MIGNLFLELSSLTEHETRGCVVATRDKTTVLVLAGARIVYFTQSSFNAVVCCFEFTIWVVTGINPGKSHGQRHWVSHDMELVGRCSSANRSSRSCSIL